MRTARSRATSLVVELWFPVVLVAMWWVSSASSKSLYFPPLGRILAGLGIILRDHWGSDIVPSLQNLALGLLFSVALGIAFGVLLGLFQPLYAAVQPLLDFMRAIPGVALIPIALFIFGIGPNMRIAIIFFGAFWPVLMNTVDGIRGVDDLVRDVARSYNLNRRDRLLRVLIPAASPQIIAGVRVSVALGVILIVASEYVASTEGIGFLELKSARQFSMDAMWASFLLLGILGYLVNILFRILEHRLLRWHRGLRGTDQGAFQ